MANGQCGQEELPKSKIRKTVESVVVFDGQNGDAVLVRQQCYPAKTFHEKSRLLIYDSLLSHTHIVRKLTFLGVQKCRCVTIGYPRNKVIQSQSLKNGSILYEDSELRNEVTVSFPIEGIFQNIFAF